jgi:ubiquitin carboxyl-terminal hydrolase 9/24
MCETEIMEGSNQVFCDQCKKNTDTVLRTAISELPNILILSLKRFDLDYSTFETVKLNSRCAFGQTLNMKRYTLEGVEAMEQLAQMTEETDAMDTGNDDSAMSHLPDENYEYKLAGVLVHAGIAQGGHYYSFIKDRNPGSEEKWYRFDDEDVTLFDPASIEVECFGGKVKKETKWPNGQVHIVESEQFANALMVFYEKVKITEQPPVAPSKDEPKIQDTKDVAMTSGYDIFEPDVRKSNAMHRWQSFLFDTEFQMFLKGLLGLCRMSSSKGSWQGGVSSKPLVFETSDSPVQDSWSKDLIEMLVIFFFDVVLYSNDRPGLGDWIQTLEDIMVADSDCALSFVRTLASKTRTVAGNWLRTYLLDCPDQVARRAGLRVFGQAIISCLSFPEEQRELRKWIEAWKNQLSRIDKKGGAIPCGIETQESGSEATDDSSAIGTILSMLNALIDAIPRTWKYSPELSMFIRNLSSTEFNNGGDIIREAIIESLIPARLLCVIIRQRAPSALRVAFPAATVSLEVAETQMRPEQMQSQHSMGMSGSQGLNNSEMNFQSTSPADYLSLFEALAALMGIHGALCAPLIVEQDDQGRGRQRIVLSDACTQALRDIFQESCSPSAPGMGRREIEIYLQKTGVAESVPPQQIMDIMAKYPTTMTTDGNGSKGTSFLSLDGFLAYYRDTSQTNEARVSGLICS